MSQIVTKFIADQAITNAKVSNSAAIAYSKLNLTNSIVNADINSAAAIAYSKLNLAASVQASDMNSGAATSGQVLTANGTGGATYTTLTTGANTALSNLTTTSINQDLLPSADLARNLGSSSLRWLNLFVGTVNSGSTALTVQSGASSSADTASVTLQSGNESGAHVSGDVNIASGTNTGSTIAALSGNVSLKSGNSTNSVSGNILITSGSGISSGTTQMGTGTVSSGTSGTGSTTIYTGGTSGSATGASGAIQITSGNVSNASATGVTGNITVESGDNAGSGDSGKITLKTGSITSGNQGVVEVIARALTLPIHSSDPSTAVAGDEYYNSTSNLIKFYNGTSWIAITSGTSVTPVKETIVLSGTDITNQYIDLSNVAQTDSILFMVQGAGSLLEGASYDYSVNYTGGAGGNTRITFLNDLATGGAAALIAGDVVQVNYVK